MPFPRTRRRAARPSLLACIIVVLTVGLTAGAGRAGAQGPSSTTTRPASTSSSSQASSQASSSAVATTAAPSTASTPAPTTSAVETTTAPTTTTTVATSSTLPPPPPVENARFPARLVAPVPPVEGEPELVVNAMYLAASEDAQAPDVVVHYRAPFALPASRYQVAVLVGDPNGPRARVSFVSSGQAGSKPTGTVEVGDGTTWTPSGATQVQHDASGFVVLRVPLAATPAGGAVWAEITQGTSVAPIVRTPFFDRTAFFGTADAGTLPASRFGRVNTPDGQAAVDIAPLDAGPVVTVNEQKIYVKYNDAPPTALLGQPVKEVVDLVRIVPNFDTGGVVGDYIRINRTEGTAGLFDGFGATPVDKSGDRGWVVRGPDGPPGPTTLVFDLEAAAEDLGITLAADRTAVGLTRSFVLGDGRIVTADGVVATGAWLDLAPPPLSAGAEAAAPAPAPADADSEQRTRRIALAAAAGFVLVALLAVVLLRRWRRHKEDKAVTAAMASRAVVGDRIPWAKNDSQLTLELDRVVVPGTAEHSLLPASGEVAAVSASSVGVAVIGAVAPPAAPTAPVTPAEAEPPPSVGHAGPVPWRSGRTGSVPAVDADPAVDQAATENEQAPEQEPEQEPEQAPEQEPEQAPEQAPEDAAAVDAADASPPVEPRAEPAEPARTGPPVPAAVPAAAGDRRRRRASGVVIAGPTVGDVVAPPGVRVGGGTPVAAGAGVVWAPEPAAPQEPANQEREVSGDPDQIDPSDALAALDLDLGSFRSRFDPEEP